MAAADPAKNIKDEATCSICLDLFTDPVTTECGHSFCRECIAQLCEEKEIDIVCPRCRQRFQKSNLRPNRELKNIVDSIPQLLSSERLRNPIEENMCETHKEPLKLYCKEDQIPICMVCERSQAHHGHTVVPMEEAVQEYWGGVAGLRQRFEVSTSSKESLDPGLGSGMHLTSSDQTQTVRVGSKKNKALERENAGENASEKQNRASSHVGEETQTPKYAINRAYRDMTPPTANPTVEEDEGVQVGVTGLRQRFEVSTSPKESLGFGLRHRKHLSPAGQTRTVRVGSKENRTLERENAGEKASEKQNRASSHVGEEMQTPKHAINRAYRDMTPPPANPMVEEDEGVQVDVEDLKQRFEGHVSLNRAADSGLKK